MRVLLSMCGSRGIIEKIVGLAVQLRTEACCAPVARSVTLTGVWR